MPSYISLTKGNNLFQPSARLRGGYGFLTDYRPMAEAAARDRIQRLVDNYGILEFQFYDWFATYSQPMSGTSWPDPYLGARETSLDTILWYIDEIHRHGGRAWAYVQSLAAVEDDLATPNSGIFPLLDGAGRWVQDAALHRFFCYFLNAAWANHQTSVWAGPVRSIGFDGIHWDTLGQQAGSYPDEVAGTGAFVRQAASNLQPFGLLQTMNFVNVAWWDQSLFTSDALAFPYAEVWSDDDAQAYFDAMELLNAATPTSPSWGVMPFYPSVARPLGWTESETMLFRWTQAPEHRLVYLVVGDDERRLVSAYFPGSKLVADGEDCSDPRGGLANPQITLSEKQQMTVALPAVPSVEWWLP